MDPELRRRWDADHEEWMRRRLIQHERDRKFDDMMWRLRWPIRIAAALAIVVLFAGSAVIGWQIGGLPPRTINVHVIRE